MLTQEQALEVVKKERVYQDSTYNPSQVLTSGQTRSQRDLDVTAHIVLLEGYVRKAVDAWVTPGTNLPALQQIAKIAAIAVRAMERAGGSEELLKGLR